MPHPNFFALPEQTQSALASLSVAVGGVIPVNVRTWKIDMSALPTVPDGVDLIQQVSDWAGKSKACLYCFENQSRDVDLVAVELAFTDAKDRVTNARAYPRLNLHGSCFYVGSSQSLAKRFKEHLGFGASETYALQLTHWARPLDLKLEFVCAKYPDGTTPEVIHALEDTLWQTRKPMFGRQGRT